ncbi:hypothetical protein [Neorhizobium sp. T25_27]|uniref:hypothetical protein n=1 Tax=Neorhizobium sp. T25_27 TaxID=2093831 RepID=UPI00155E879E|nr:hypothetical protein [Neorhizobium sp. T25_27]
MEWPTPSKNALVGHYIFDSGTKICFPPMVFALRLEGVFSYLWSKSMKEYERDVTVVGGAIRIPARLKVIRLPRSWYGVVWSDDLDYASFSQDATEVNGGIADMSDKQFLARVQLVAASKGGVNFEYAPEPSTSDDDKHSLDGLQAVDHQIRCIVDLDMHHIAVASELYMTMCDDDPTLARTWMELDADERSEWTAEHKLRRITMLSRAFKVLRSHPRYGYVATWLRGWGDEACALKQHVALQLGGDWAKVEGLLNAELDRRRVG